MQIYVNDEKLTAKLTGEKNLQEVYQSFDKWLSCQKRYILGLQVNGQEVSQGDLAQIQTDTTERLDFYVGDELDILLNSTAELDRYIDQVGAILFEQDILSKEDQKNLKDGLQWVRQILTSIASISGTSLETMDSLVPGNNKGDAIHDILQSLEKHSNRFCEKNDRNAIEIFLTDLRACKFFVMQLNSQLQNIGASPHELLKSIENYSTQLPEHKQTLININEHFQKGEDTIALENLEKMTTQLDICISALYALDYRTYDKEKNKSQIIEILIDSVSFHSVTTELKQLLQELADALEQGDIVAVGDILEYELTEKLNCLDPYLKKIANFCRKELFSSDQETKQTQLLANTHR